MKNDAICCWGGTFEALSLLARDEFMNPVMAVFQSWVGERASLSQVRSWRDAFRVMKYRVYNRLGDWEKFCWKNALVVFELGLPKRKKERFSKRIDVTLITKEQVIIVEFKRHKDTYDGFLKQVVGYCQRVRRMEALSAGKTVHGILCYSQIEDEIFELQEGALDNGWSENVIVCSQDKLKDALRYLRVKA